MQKLRTHTKVLETQVQELRMQRDELMREIPGLQEQKSQTSLQLLDTERALAEKGNLLSELQDRCTVYADQLTDLQVRIKHATTNSEKECLAREQHVHTLSLQAQDIEKNILSLINTQKQWDAKLNTLKSQVQKLEDDLCLRREELAKASRDLLELQEEEKSRTTALTERECRVAQAEKGLVQREKNLQKARKDCTIYAKRLQGYADQLAPHLGRKITVSLLWQETHSSQN